MHSPGFISAWLRKLRRMPGDCLQFLHDGAWSTPFAAGIGVLVFGLIGALGELLLLSYQREAESENRAILTAHAANLRARVDRELNAVMYLSSGLSAYLAVRHDRLDDQELAQILARLYGASRHIRNFAIATGYQVSHVYPLAGNERVIGTDYTRLPQQWPAIQRAVASGRGTLAGPVDLIQGGRAFIYRLPIFVDDGYWGMFSTVIDTDAFFAAAFAEFELDAHDFAIRGQDGKGMAGDVLWGNPAIFSDPDVVRIESEVPNGKWVYAVRSHVSPVFTWSVWLLRGGGWLLAALGGAVVAMLLIQRARLARHAGLDSLTGLPNRRLLDDRLEQAMRRHVRSEADLIGVLFIDLDGFKAINDDYGHKAGDVALRVAAQRIREEVRLSDTVARWGGDEFVVVVEDADEALLQNLSLRLRQSLAQPFDAAGRSLQLAASIGMALLSAAAATPEMLLELADRRMFEEKQRKKRS